ncbi:RluA family pseudouridine synthase [Akkermansiaceae bacterium]|nr:RluA family pseudouridine synthase [Akkermansiaceae bacterium]
MRIVVECEQASRLDVFLSKKLPELSRSRIQSLIKSEHILLNERSTKAKAAIHNGDLISVDIPQEAPSEAQPEDIPLEVLFEDAHIIVINKTSGMVVHPASGNEGGTLVNALLHHCSGKLAPIGGEQRPGIVHRLDKDTSGCIISAKTDNAHEHLVSQFADRTTHKEYITVTQGHPPIEKDTLTTNIGRHPVNRLKMAVLEPPAGKHAITDYQLSYYDEASDSSLIHCIIHTGRTHQIRVHMTHIGCPIIGDVIYAKVSKQKAQTGRLMLHARKLRITHPITKEQMTFIAPIPQEYTPWVQHSDAEIYQS